MAQPELTPDKLVGDQYPDTLREIVRSTLDHTWKAAVVLGKISLVGATISAGLGTGLAIANSFDVSYTDAHEWRGAPRAIQALRSIPCRTSEYSMPMISGAGLETSADASEDIAAWAAEYGVCTYAVEYGKQVQEEAMADVLVAKALEGRKEGDKPKIIIMTESTGGLMALKIARVIHEKYENQVELTAIVTSSMPTSSKDIKDDATRILAENSSWLRFGYHTYWGWEAYTAMKDGKNILDPETQLFVTSVADRVSTELLFSQLKMIDEGAPTDLDTFLDDQTVLYSLVSANPNDDGVIKIKQATDKLQGLTSRTVHVVPVNHGHSEITFDTQPYEHPIKLVLAEITGKAS